MTERFSRTNFDFRMKICSDRLPFFLTHQCMNEDIAFFEFRGKITNRGHAEDQGEPVHCIVKMKSLDAEGKRRRNVDLEQEAGDTILFALSPGPHRKMSHCCCHTTKTTFTHE
jgi:hypothetical protein